MADLLTVSLYSKMQYHCVNHRNVIVLFALPSDSAYIMSALVGFMTRRHELTINMHSMNDWDLMFT